MCACARAQKKKEKGNTQSQLLGAVCLHPIFIFGIHVAIGLRPVLRSPSVEFLVHL